MNLKITSYITNTDFKRFHIDECIQFLFFQYFVTLYFHQHGVLKKCYH